MDNEDIFYCIWESIVDLSERQNRKKLSNTKSVRYYAIRVI